MSTPPAVAARRPCWQRGILRTGLYLVVAVVVALVVRGTVAEAFSAATDAVAPEVPRGSHLLVSKLTSTYTPGDIVVFRDEGKNYLGRVEAVNAAGRQVTITRNGEPNRTVEESEVIGRTVWNTR